MVVPGRPAEQAWPGYFNADAHLDLAVAVHGNNAVQILLGGVAGGPLDATGELRARQGLSAVDPLRSTGAGNSRRFPIPW